MQESYIDWQPANTLPQGGCSVLVWLSRPLQLSRIHTLTRNLNGIATIAGRFDFDVLNKSTYIVAWAWIPNTPDLSDPKFSK